MPFTTRMYARAEDRDRIALFLSEASAAIGSEPSPGYWHPGDLIWGMYQNTVFDPKMSLRLWEDAATGALLGVTWLEVGVVSGEMETQLAPAIRATDGGAAILGQALVWGRRVAARRQVVTLWARPRFRSVAARTTGGARILA